MKRFLRPRKGNLLIITMFAVAIAIVTFVTLQVMTSVYASARENAKQYANIQSYRAMSEIACYTYITELCAQTEVVDLAAGFISPSTPGMYSTVLQGVQDSIGSASDPLVWRTSKITSALSGAVISDPQVTVDLLGLCSKGINEFELKLANYPEIDWSAEGNSVSGGSGLLAIYPLEVNIRLRIRGEMIKETFLVYGLKLSVEREGRPSDGKLIVQIVESDEGVKIYRD